MKKLIVTLIVLAACVSAIAAPGTWLRKSTAVTIKLKPVWVYEDGTRKTTGITAHAAHVLISKAGGASAAKNDANAPTVEAVTGQRVVKLDAADTDTVGILIVDWPDANGVTVPESFFVVDADAYDCFTDYGFMSTTDIRSAVRYQLAAAIGDVNDASVADYVMTPESSSDPNSLLLWIKKIYINLP